MISDSLAMSSSEDVTMAARSIAFENGMAPDAIALETNMRKVKTRTYNVWGKNKVRRLFFQTPS